jgi:membrane protease YdiL (CAAX protease family)
MALTAMLQKVDAKFGALLAMLLSLAGIARDRWAEPKAAQIPGSGGRLQRAAQAGTIISVVVIGVIALIGILIFAQINDALPTIDNTQLSQSATGVTDGFANAMELVPIVLLVLVAALVIAVVQRMRGNQM